MVSEILVYAGSGDALLPDGTRLILTTSVILWYYFHDNHQVMFETYTLKIIAKLYLQRDKSLNKYIWYFAVILMNWSMGSQKILLPFWKGEINNMPYGRYVLKTFHSVWNVQSIIQRAWLARITHYTHTYTHTHTHTHTHIYIYIYIYSELKWSGGWNTGTVNWLSASERDQYLDGCPAMNTKCLVPLPFLPDLILWSTENRSHGSPVLVPPETQ